MAYEGWMSFAGTEIFSAPRTLAYVRSELPTVKIDDSCGSDCGCDNLPGLLGDHPYNTPLIDDAPWIDHDRPESYDFLGLYPLGITGLTDDTVEIESLDAVGDGGWFTSRRRAMREVHVKGVLMSRSLEGAHYGETWLKAALEGSCDNSCGMPTDTLCFLTACVDPSDFGGRSVRRRHISSDWVLSDGAHWVESGVLRFPTTGAWARLTVPGTACGPVEWELDLDVRKGGQNLLIEHDGVVDVHWVQTGQDYLKVTTQGTEITLRAAPVDFNQSQQGASWTSKPAYLAGESAHFTRDVTLPYDNDASWGTLDASDTPVDVELSFDVMYSRSFTETGDEECLKDLLRHLNRVLRTEGPIFGREEHLGSGGVIRNVSFTLTAENPYVYGEMGVIISGSLEGPRDDHADFYFGRLPSVIDACTPADKTSGVIYDPARGAFPKPPTPPMTRNAFRDKVVAVSEPPYAVLIPDYLISQWQVVVPRLEVTAKGNDLRFVTVRFFPVPLDSTILTEVDPCSACGEFEIAYVPEGGTFIADASMDAATIERPGFTTAVANHLLTDANGVGRAVWPELSCGSAYLMVVDTHGQKVHDVRLSLAARE